MPLTADRAKPAVPFGGNYRLIDFALSNLVNAGYRRIAVLTQYKSHSLDRHIATTWRLSPLLGNYVDAGAGADAPRAAAGSQGSADAIYQNLNLLHDERPDYVCVFGADHIYRMDPRQMVEQHIESGAGGDGRGAPGADRPGRPVRRDRDRRRRAHDRGLPREADATPSGSPTRPDQVYASMGNYVFTHRGADRRVTADAATSELRSTTWAATSSRCSSSAGRRTSTTSRSNEVPGATRARRAATGATSGRSTPTTTRTWT